MPDRPELAINPRVNAAQVDSVGSALQREAELLRDGLGSGIVNRAKEMWNNPGETLLSLSACAVAGGALNLASRAGGRWAAGSRVAGVILTTSFGVDVARRAVPTLGAMSDTWSNPDLLKSSKETVAKYAGSALVDYPLMMATGYGGFKAAGQIPMRANRLHCTELSPNLMQNNGSPAGTKALVESGIQINAITSLKPGDRAAAFIAETAKHPAVRLAESGVQLNAAAAKHPALRLTESGVQLNAAAAKHPALRIAESGVQLNVSAAKHPAVRLAERKISTAYLHSSAVAVRSEFTPTVVPFDLIIR